jgi:hypothetical protein
VIGMREKERAPAEGYLQNHNFPPLAGGVLGICVWHPDDIKVTAQPQCLIEHPVCVCVCVCVNPTLKGRGWL